MSSPLLCAPSDKPKLEARNGVEQLDYISYLIDERHVVELRESHLQEFHEIAIRDIYPCGAQYRTARHNVFIRGSSHRVPDAALVPSLVRDLVDELNAERKSGTPAIDRAAYVLWRTNWIHPFAGGNGRTARALCYLVLCIDLEMVPPGRPSLPTMIYENRKGYMKALRAADKAWEKTGRADVKKMKRVVEDGMTRQLASAIDRLAGPGTAYPSAASRAWAFVRSIFRR